MKHNMIKTILSYCFKAHFKNTYFVKYLKYSNTSVNENLELLSMGAICLSNKLPCIKYAITIVPSNP